MVFEILLIPTDKPSHVYIQNNKLCYDEYIIKSTKDCGDYNLHIISEEEKKDGDWVYESDGQVLKYKYQLDRFSRNSFKKIITSTDELLTCNGVKREGESCTYNNNCKYPKCKLPCISVSFIKEFMKFYNEGTIVSKVSIEMNGEQEIDLDKYGCAKLTVAEFKV